MKATVWMGGLMALVLDVHAATAELAADFYGGAGLGSRSVDDEGRTVVALFVGLEAGHTERVGWSFELGYYDTSEQVGEGTGDGYWVGGLLGIPLGQDVRGVLRASAALGNTPGDHAGVGFGYRIAHDMETRFEVVSLDGDTTLLFSVAYYPFRYR